MVGLLLPAAVVIVATTVISRFADRLRPWLATWALSTLSIAAVMATAGALAAIIVDQLSSVPWLAARLGWCARVAGGPVAAGLVAASLAGVASAVVNLTRTARLHHADARGFGPDSVVVVPSAAAFAMAVPGRVGRPGQIVVTTGMLKALDADERAAMFAHEDAHLRLRHHLFLRASGLAAAAFPLLRSVHRRVSFATERWADERAAREVGSRSLVARAVAKGALAAAGQSVPPGAMALTGTSTEARITALVDDRPRRAAPTEAAFTTAAVVTIGLAATQLHHLVTLALQAC